MLAGWIPTLTTQVAWNLWVAWKSRMQHDVLPFKLLEWRPGSHVGHHAHSMTGWWTRRTIFTLLHQHLLLLLLYLLMVLCLLLLLLLQLLLQMLLMMLQLLLLRRLLLLWEFFEIPFVKG